jgi:hypothetical protein
MTSSGKVGEIFASAGEAFARENRFFPQPYCILICVVDPRSGGSVIVWPPGSGSVILNYGCGSESLSFIKDAIKFQKSSLS